MLGENAWPYIEAYQNLGAVNSSGLEYAIFADLAKTPKLDWELGVLGAIYFQTTLVDYGFQNLDVERFIGRLGGICPFPVFRLKDGEPLGEIWGAVLDPNNPVTADGGWAYTDVDKDGFIDEWRDKTVIGNALPKHALGITNRIKKGNWEIAMLLRGVFGHDIINHTRSFHTARSTISALQHSE